MLERLEDGVLEICREFGADDPSIDCTKFKREMNREIGKGMLLAKQALEVLKLIELQENEIEFVDREPLDD